MMGLFDFLKGKKNENLDIEEDEEYLKRHRKLQGIILVYGKKGSGRTSLLKYQLSLDVFRTYYVIVVGSKKEYDGIVGVDYIIDPSEIESFSKLRSAIKDVLKKEKVKSAVIVFEDADDLAKKFDEKRFWRYVSSLSHKHQIIISTIDPPDGIRQPQMIVRLFEPGGNVAILFSGKDRVARDNLSWVQIQNTAIFMVALLE